MVEGDGEEKQWTVMTSWAEPDTAPVEVDNSTI